jgi:hypothetical protein
MSELTDSDIQRLKDFYNVQTERQLISAQDYHIRKLQRRVKELEPPEPAYRPVRG